MKLPGFLRLTFRNIMVNLDVGTLMFMLGMPGLYLVVLGVMFQGIVPSVSSSNGSTSYLTFLTPGIVGMQTLTAGSIGAGMLWADRRWGMFEQILVGPFKRVEYILGIMLLSVIFTLAGGAIMILIALGLSVSLSFTLLNAIILLLSLSIGAMFFSSLFLIISLKLKTMNAYNSATIFLFFFLDFASTAFYPVTSKTPYALRIFSAMNPLSYIVDISRDTMTYNAPYQALPSLGVIAVMMVVFFAIAMYMYSHLRGSSA